MATYNASIEKAWRSAMGPAAAEPRSPVARTIMSVAAALRHKWQHVTYERRVSVMVWTYFS